MKTRILLVLTVVLLTVSCEDNLELSPLDKISAAEVWKNEELASAAVLDVYNVFGESGLEQNGGLAGVTDESMDIHGPRVQNENNQSDSNVGLTDDMYGWNHLYKYIRAANLAIQGLNDEKGGKLLEKAVRDELLGEAYFLRAYAYHRLLGHYGGVIILKKPLDYDSDNKLSRATFEEVVTFIVEDCEQAITLLNGKTLAVGRASKAAAMALKSRVLIRAASDLYHLPTASAKISTLSSYANKKYLGYEGGDRNARYQAAKTAAKAVVDLTAYGHNLNLSAPLSFEEAKKSYEDVYLYIGGGKKEMILPRMYNKDRLGGWADDIGGHRALRHHGPNGYYGWGGQSPLQNLVDAYEIRESGNYVAFDWSKDTHKSNIYKLREPRFYATILYDGAPWKPRPGDAKAYDPYDQIQTGKYQVVKKDGTKEYQPGLDTRQGPIANWNGGFTGYYYKKYMDPNPQLGHSTDYQEIPYPLFRYTEAVFNYIEACIKTGDENQAKTYLNKIRFRAGLPATTASGDQLWNLFIKEKYVEMVWEEQRFYDGRRWIMGKETIGQPSYKINITADLKAGQTQERNKYKYDETKYTYSYVKQLSRDRGERQWSDKRYFFPIHRNEINSNPKIKQNPGY